MMTYDLLGPEPLNYLPCRYGRSRLLFRGPRRDLARPYAAFVGATETYGKFLSAPFPALVEQATGLPCVNFGQINAGLDTFVHDPEVLGSARQAKATVVQVMGAQNISNRLYSVHRRRNDRFLNAAATLVELYPEVDFARFSFTRHMLGALLDTCPERFQTVRNELAQAWKDRTREMLERIGDRAILLWFSQQSPDDEEAALRIGADPLFVTREMLEEVAPLAREVVEVTVSPQAVVAGTDGMIYDRSDAPAAAEMLGPAAHAEAASAIAAAIGRIA